MALAVAWPLAGALLRHLIGVGAVHLVALSVLVVLFHLVDEGLEGDALGLKLHHQVDPITVEAGEVRGARVELPHLLGAPARGAGVDGEALHLLNTFGPTGPLTGWFTASL